MRRQKRELGVAIVVDKLDRRGKAAQQRRDRWRRNVDESKRLTCLFHVQDTRRRSRRPLARERERQIVAFGIQQADREGNVKGLLVCLTRRGSGLLLDVERVAKRRRIVMAARTHHGRARLRVPAAKLHEIDVRRVLHRLDEVVARDGAAVVTREVEVHAAPETLRPKQRMLHSNDLGALLVNRCRIEIVDLLIFVGTHRMRHRSSILGELLAAQIFDRADPFDGARPHVARKFLIAKYRQSFLERQLEPIAAGHAIAGPVVEIFVADHALDRAVVNVGSDLRVGEQQATVENVEPFVLHRAHVEVGHGHDHEHVEVVFAAEGLLVPAHRALERVHRIAAAVFLAGLHIDAQRHVAA